MHFKKIYNQRKIWNKWNATISRSNSPNRNANKYRLIWLRFMISAITGTANKRQHTPGCSFSHIKYIKKFIYKWNYIQQKHFLFMNRVSLLYTLQTLIIRDWSKRYPPESSSSQENSLIFLWCIWIFFDDLYFLFLRFFLWRRGIFFYVVEFSLMS